MNTLQKKAFKILKQKISDFESQKQHVLSELFKNDEFKNLRKKENELIIELSKQEDEKAAKLLQKQLTEVSNQKITLAKKLNKFGSILQNEYLCNDCKDTGFKKEKPCTCLKQIMNEILLNESGIQLQLTSFEKTDFSIFDNADKIKQTYKALKSWTEKFTESNIKNWGFFGYAGTGKTHLMLTVANELMKKGHLIYFTTAFNMVKDMLSQHTDFEDKERDYLSKYLDCEVLFIDDLGTEPTYNNVSENYLYLIANQRMIENKPIIFSSNYNLNEFEDRYGERIFSRLINKRNSKALWFEGEDLRLKNDKK